MVDIHQRKSFGVQLPGKLRIVKLIQPVRVSTGRAMFRSVIKQQWQPPAELCHSLYPVTLHGGSGHSALAEKPYSFCRALMFNHAVDIAVTVAGFHGPQNIRSSKRVNFSIKLVGSRA